MPVHLREAETSDVDFVPIYMEIDKEHWYARQKYPADYISWTKRIFI